MTISDPTRVVSAVGNGVTTVWPYTFLIPDEDNLIVSVLDVATGDLVPIDPSLYTVIGIGEETGGTVTYPLVGTPLVDTKKLVIERQVPYTQGLDVNTQSTYDPSLIEDQLDLIVMQTQQLAEEISRAFKVTIGTNVDPDVLSGLINAAPTAIAAAATATAAANLALQYAADAAGVSGVNVPIYASVVTATAATIAAGVKNIRVQYYSPTYNTPGTLKGEASYARAVSQPAHAAKFRSTDRFLPDGSISAGNGGWWELVAADGRVRAGQLGAQEGTDVTAALQNAVDFAIYGGAAIAVKPSLIEFDVGAGTLSDAIQVGYGTDFRTVHIRGLGANEGATATLAGTSLNAAALVSRPALSIQGGRDTTVEGLAIAGPAVSAITALIAALLGHNWADSTQWDAALTAAGITPGRRYAPHCLIAIDPYAGAAPTPHYPDVTYPSFLGAVSQYSKNLSSKTILEHLYLTGAEVGLMQQPNTDGNGDFTEFKHAIIAYCKYGVSAGNSQARLTDLSNSAVIGAYAAIVGNVHGVQQGRWNGVIDNFSTAVCFELFQFGDLAQQGPLTFDNLYMESTLRLGQFDGATSNGATLKFVNPQISLPPAIFFNDKAVVGSLIAGNDPIDVVALEGGTVLSEAPTFLGRLPARIIDTALSTYVAPAKGYLYPAYNNLPIVLDPLAQQVCEPMAYAWDIDAGTLAAMKRHNRSYSRTDRTHGIPVFMADGACLTRGAFHDKQLGAVAIAVSTLGSVTRTDRTITFVFSAATGEQSFYLFNLLVGCVLLHRESGTVMIIRQVDYTGGTKLVTVEMQNNYYYDGANYQILDSAFTLVAGNWYALNTLVYAPAYALWGDVTAGSAVIANVLDANGTLTDTNFGLTVGDYLPALHYPSQMTAQPRKITAIDTTAKTITLDGVFFETRAGVDLNFWIRTPPAGSGSR